MKPKTEELLYLLLWTCDMFRSPAHRIVTESFEGWAYRNGLLRQLQDLHDRKIIEMSKGADAKERLVRLTEAGMKHVMLGRDPEQCWSRAWDGKWRLIVFDLPSEMVSQRKHLWYYLRQRHFGCLQQSVWISPDPLTEQRELLKNTTANARHLTLLDATPCGGESVDQLVNAAWDFTEINKRYAEYLRVLQHRPGAALNNTSAAQAFRKWLNEERQAWADAFNRDPLLPEQALPKEYAGKKAWQTRLQVMPLAARQIRAFKPPGENKKPSRITRKGVLSPGGIDNSAQV